MAPIKKVTKPLRGMSQRERREFAQSAGVPFDTVQKIAIGATKNPRWQTMSAIVDCLRARRKRGAA